MGVRKKAVAADSVSSVVNRETAASTPVDVQRLNRFVGYALRRAQVAYFGDFARAVGGTDIRPAEFAALVVISANQGLTQSAIALVLGIDRSAGVSLIDRLESKGLALRVPVPTDRRSYAIMLTAAGQELLGQLMTSVTEHEDLMLKNLSKAERDTLLELLHKLY